MCSLLFRSERSSRLHLKFKDPTVLYPRGWQSCKFHMCNVDAAENVMVESKASWKQQLSLGRWDSCSRKNIPTCPCQSMAMWIGLNHSCDRVCTFGHTTIILLHR